MKFAAKIVLNPFPVSVSLQIILTVRTKEKAFFHCLGVVASCIHTNLKTHLAYLDASKLPMNWPRFDLRTESKIRKSIPNHAYAGKAETLI